MKRFCKGGKLCADNVPLRGAAPTPQQAALILPMIFFSQKATISDKPLLRFYVTLLSGNADVSRPSLLPPLPSIARLLLPSLPSSSGPC